MGRKQQQKARYRGERASMGLAGGDPEDELGLDQKRQEALREAARVFQDVLTVIQIMGLTSPRTRLPKKLARKDVCQLQHDVTLWLQANA